MNILNNVPNHVNLRPYSDADTASENSGRYRAESRTSPIITESSTKIMNASSRSRTWRYTPLCIRSPAPHRPPYVCSPAIRSPGCRHLGISKKPEPVGRFREGGSSFSRSRLVFDPIFLQKSAVCQRPNHAPILLPSLLPFSFQEEWREKPYREIKGLFI